MDENQAQFEMTNVQEVDVTVAITDENDEAVEVEGVSWDSEDPSICEVILNDEDPLSVILRSTGVVGSTRINFICDADLSEGELPVPGFIDIELTDAQEFFVNFSFGEPRRRVTEPEA